MLTWKEKMFHTHISKMTASIFVFQEHQLPPNVSLGSYAHRVFKRDRKDTDSSTHLNMCMSKKLSDAVDVIFTLYYYLN